MLFGITDDNIELLREGRPIKCSLRTEMGEELPDLTIAIVWGASISDIVADLRRNSTFDAETREIVVPNSGHSR